MQKALYSLTVCALSALCLACHTTTAPTAPPSSGHASLAVPSAPPTNGKSEPEHAPVEQASAKAPSAQAPVVEGTEDPAARSAAPGQVHYALAKHLAHAELRRGNTQLVDFGVPGDAKYTLGGWLTFAGERRTLDDTRVLVMRGKSVKLALPSDDAGEKRLSLRVRAFRETSLTVHLNGEKLGDHPLSGRALETVTLTLPSALVKRGENLLELRVANGGSAPGMPEAGFAIDWLALAPVNEPEANAAGFDTRALVPKTPAETLRVEPGMRIGYAFDVPANALLEASAQTDGAGKLVVSAVRDGAATSVLGTFQLTNAAQPIQIDLSGLSGSVVRLELGAENGAVTLGSPRVAVRQLTAQKATTKKPIKNAIIVLIDTLRADKLSPYNPKTRVKTPGLSRFLESAAVMQNARTQENWTKPSVATLLSSLFPWEHSAYTDAAKVPESVDLLPEILRKQGFFTGAFIANGYVSDKFGFGQGWNTYRNYIREGRRTIAQEVAADMLDWLDSRPKDKPFFLYVHTIDPHVPYKPPEHFLSMYDAQPYSGPVDFAGKSDMLEQIKIGKVPMKPRDKERLMALYDGEISYHDVHFAAMLEGLQKRGLADETVVVVTADHGEEFWDHGSVGHGHSVWDELLHIPLIVRIPGVTEGNPGLSSAVGLVDIAPTVLEVLGQNVPENMSGKSFLPDLMGDTTDAPRVAVSGFMTGWRTAAIGQHKLIHRTIDRMWLYDVANDPGEKQDLAPQSPLALRYLRGQLGLSLDGREDQSSGATRSVVHKQENTKIDAETEAQLRALGYVGTSRP